MEEMEEPLRIELRKEGAFYDCPDNRGIKDRFVIYLKTAHISFVLASEDTLEATFDRAIARASTMLKGLETLKTEHTTNTPK